MGPFVFRGRVPVNGEWLIERFAPWRETMEAKNPNPELDDPILWQYPNKRLAAEALKEGRIPLWNPLVLCGSTQIGDAISNPFDPFNALVFVMPFPAAYGLALYLKWILAGFGMAVLLRRLGLSPAAAAVASVAFALNNRFTTHAELRNAVDSFFLLPWILDAVLRLLDSPGPGRLAAAGALIGIQGLSADAQSFAMTIGWILGASALRYAFPPRPSFAGLSAIPGAVALGCLLAAPHLLALLESISGSVREGLAQYADRNFLHLAALPTLALPEFLGNPAQKDGFASFLLAGAGPVESSRSFVGMGQGYAGALGLALAFIGIVKTRHPAPRVVAALAGLGLSFLLLMGSGDVRSAVYAVLPAAGNVDLLRSLIFWAFAAAVCAGFGFDALRNGSQELRRGILASLAVLFIVWICLETAAFRVVGQMSEATEATKELRQEILDRHPPFVQYLASLATQFRAVGLAPGIAPSLLFLVTGMLAAVLALEKRQGAWPLGLLVALHASELVFFGTRYNPFTDSDRLYPRTAQSDFLQARAKEGRVLGIAPPGASSAKGDHFPPNSLMPFGVADVRGKGYCSRRLGRLFKAMEGGRARNLMERSPRKVVLSSRLLPLLGAKWILMGERPPQFVEGGEGFRFEVRAREEPPPGFSLALDGKGTRIYRFAGALPRAHFTGAAMPVPKDDGETAFALVESGAVVPGREVLVEGAVEGFKSDPSARADVRILEDAPERVRVGVVDATAEGWLVLLDAFDSGWEASVNNSPAKILPAFHVFRAVRVPKGSSAVEFVYRPRSYRLGVRVAGFSLLVLIVLALSARFRRKAA